MTYELDERLAADSLAVARLPLSELRLMNDARYQWFILVPRQAGLTEFIDLEVVDQAQLVSEISFMSVALKSLYAPDKLNIAMLGNMVPQLHVHVIARKEDDAAWPAPVWGVGDMVEYSTEGVAEVVEVLVKYIHDNTTMG